jgi:hypothetical protein
MTENGGKSKKNQNLDEYLKAKISDSGYPLEIEISGLLDSEYFVRNTFYYFDKEAESGRSIDIYASPKFTDLKGFEKIIPFCNLVIECKKSSNHAWIFFTRPYGSDSKFEDISGQIKSSIPKVKPFEIVTIDSWIGFALYSDLHYASFDRIAIAYDEIKIEKKDDGNAGSNKGRKEILEAIMQLQKFICFQEHRSKNWSVKSLPDESYFDDLMIFIPIIVFDGNLLEATFNSGLIDLHEKKHILVKTSFLCPYCKRIETFTIDVVHSSYFDDFKQILKNDFIGSLKTLRNNQEYIFEGSKNARAALKKLKS